MDSQEVGLALDVMCGGRRASKKEQRLSVIKWIVKC